MPKKLQRTQIILKEWQNHWRQQKEILFNWMINNIGKRCPDFEQDCIVCHAWKYYDYLIGNNALG